MVNQLLLASKDIEELMSFECYQHLVFGFEEPDWLRGPVVWPPGFFDDYDEEYWNYERE